MTRQFQHPAPWSSLDDAGAGERPTPLINTIIVRDDAQAQYPSLDAGPLPHLAHDIREFASPLGQQVFIV
jgi:hypothetical protein